ncbi:MAG: hypothetical protein ACLUFE_07590 [Anaerostipes hadrus]
MLLIRTVEEDIKAGEVYDKLSGDYVVCKKLLGNTNEDEMEDDEL